MTRADWNELFDVITEYVDAKKFKWDMPDLVGLAMMMLVLKDAEPNPLSTDQWLFTVAQRMNRCEIEFTE